MAVVGDGDWPDQADELVEILARRETVAFAAQRLASMGLARSRYDVDDLLMGVFERVWRRLVTLGPIGDGRPEPLERYVNRTITNAVVDLLTARGRTGRLLNVDEVLGPEGDRPRVPVLDVADHGEGDATDWDAVRLVAQARITSKRPWVTAAVLAHLAVDEAPDRNLPGHLRRPRQAGEGQVTNWVALQYAGLERCFEEPETAAVTKRRSKAVGRLTDALREAVTIAWNLPGWVTSGREHREDRL